MAEVEERMFPIPNKGSKKSDVWEHFSFKLIDRTKPPTEENLDLQYVYCNYCKKQYKNHSKRARNFLLR